MLDPWIIEKLLEKEREDRTEQSQIELTIYDEMIDYENQLEENEDGDIDFTVDLELKL